MRIPSLKTDARGAPEDGGKRAAESAALLVLIERLLEQQRRLAEAKAKTSVSAAR